MQTSKAIFDRISSRRQNWITEEEVRKGWLLALEETLNIEFHAERRRNDASFRHVVIEFKNNGLFNSSTNSSAFKEAIYERLLPYILTRAQSENIHSETFLGIATDSHHIVFSTVKNGNIFPGPLMPVNYDSIKLLVTELSRTSRIGFSSSNLITELGHTSDVGRNLMQALADSLTPQLNSSETVKTRMLFEEWRTLFGQVANLTANQVSEITSSIPFNLNIRKSEKIPATLFVIHTYNSLVMKLLAAEILASSGFASFSDFAATAATLSDSLLIRTLKNDIEKGKLFSSNGINGFVEEAIFGWYLDNNDIEKIVQPVRLLLIQLSTFRFDTIEYSATGDVLKQFYQDLVPEVLRKSLGEFYTPDWLVECFFDKAAEDYTVTTRLLDPTCGSGSFLMAAIERKKKLASQLNLSPSATLDSILDSVWGFDLNPLAVQTARVNYLISIADLLRQVPGKQIEIPVLLADAVYSPAPDPTDGTKIVEYVIGSSTANLRVELPSAIVLNRKLLDQIFEVMGECVELDMSFEVVAQLLKDRQLIEADRAGDLLAPLEKTYGRVLELHHKQWNGIWFRIVRNFFWSAVAGNFDLIIGNPPWVKWSNLPEVYRERIKPTCEKYDIFSSNPHHGGNELDISGMISYTVADKWLRESGKLAFVLTQTHFQSPSSEGFRRFKINNEFNLTPRWVEDLKEIRPFPEAANKTALCFFEKTRGEQTRYPIPYTIWRATEGFARVIPENISKDEALARTVRLPWEATPVGGLGSPWAILPPGRFNQLSSINRPSQWVQGRKGITADLNGIYFVDLIAVNDEERLVQIETRPEAGRNDIGPKRRFWVEPDLLYPLLKGAADFSAFKVTRRHNLFTFIPNAGIQRSDYASAERIVTALRLTNSYFENYRSVLQERSTYRTRMPGAPYFAIYNVGDYTFSPFKVFWAEQSGHFKAAVASGMQVPIVGNRSFVPDHKIFFVDFNDENEAHYLCCMLNNPVVAEYLYSHNISIQVGNIFKHLDLPRYDSRNANHLRLVQVSRELHVLDDEDQRATLIAEAATLSNTCL